MVQSLSIGVCPREEGLTPYRVCFQRVESTLVPSVLAEGLRYRHTAGEQTAIVWAQDEAGIAAVLTYHYQDSWHSAEILTPHGRSWPAQQGA
jgi:hypothetical protein